MTRKVALLASLFTVACSPEPGEEQDGGDVRASDVDAADVGSLPDPTDAASCPAVAPSPGEACSVPQTCWFDGHCGVRILATCGDGVWRNVYNLTAMVPGCSGAELTTCRAAQTCQAHTGCIAAVAKDLHYYYDCGAHGTLSFVASINAPAASSCPSTAPAPGALCTSQEPGECIYQGHCGITTASRCEAGHWIVRYDLRYLSSPQCAGAELTTCAAGATCTPGSECWTPGSGSTESAYTCDGSGHLQFSSTIY